MTALADLPPTLSLADDEVHVWQITLSQFIERESERRAVLDRTEREQADRFRFADDRARYVVSHWFVRALLAAYLGAPPERLEFERGPWGKPALLKLREGAPLEYSLSHSGDLALVALARERPLGVDVERWADGIAYDRLAAFCFSPHERRQLSRAADDDKARAFFAGWTRKEAFIKATGAGVAFGLEYFDVTLTAGDARLLANRRRAKSAAAWTMCDISMPTRYSAALVAQGKDWALRRYELASTRLEEAR